MNKMEKENAGGGGGGYSRWYRYIGEHGRRELRKHKYSGVDNSYLARYVFQPFWTRSLSLFPIWLPPNVITLIGFTFLLTSALLSWIYSPHLDLAPPRWVHFAHGLLLFLYQTFDAVDGKQARRTGSTSPLGELFDHGCDALACTFEALAIGSTMMCGRDAFWFWVIAAIPFYFATWEHFFTNTLVLPVINGPTEGLMLIYLCHFLTSLLGADWWIQPLSNSMPFLSWLPLVNAITTYRVALILMTIFAVLPTVILNVCNVGKVVRGRKGSIFQALIMIYPLGVLLGGVLAWQYFSPSNITGNYPHLVILGTGLAFGYLVGRMILARLCDEMENLTSGMYLPLLYLPLAIANAVTKLGDGRPLVDETLVLVGYCIFTAAFELHLAVTVTHEITAALGIQCFRITRKEA